ncbi:hypothetical protein BO70DRAFT_169654 [Aspergillus heteromorphus CBS 117.55]|uniref:Secreted protein n=1 Tax=Aspergillus heteromorphus CBS 117.55 TaxID=1448321 RepID=A0A317UYK3_9EURO|nr:uncharacterized protein BO70DRAFT_169654 [Aspergillus heteromorphus CBS 117.55]PWY67144.1 hypothetical protein BO70DRAFT_169654 [Aspergillus heteromorphus CBS 117.55]
MLRVRGIGGLGNHGVRGVMAMHICYVKRLLMILLLLLQAVNRLPPRPGSGHCRWIGIYMYLYHRSLYLPTYLPTYLPSARARKSVLFPSFPVHRSPPASCRDPDPPAGIHSSTSCSLAVLGSKLSACRCR